MRIHIGNLDRQTNGEDLRAAFAAHGAVASAAVLLDRESGLSRGFGFVEMPDKDEAERAIAALNQTTLQNSTVAVNKARTRSDQNTGSRSRQQWP